MIPGPWMYTLTLASLGCAVFNVITYNSYISYVTKHTYILINRFSLLSYFFVKYNSYYLLYFFYMYNESARCAGGPGSMETEFNMIPKHVEEGAGGM